MRVLLVCTGNICRSPVAERFLGEHWSGEWDVHVSSAGTRAHVGAPIYSPVRKLLVERGLAEVPFLARQLTPALVQAADLVLVMTREHRSAVVVLHPAAVRRTFTLREFARVAPMGEATMRGNSLGERLASLVSAASRLRGLARVSAAEDAIVDPYGRGDSACLAAVDQIEHMVDDVVSVLGTSSHAGQP